MGCAKFTWFFIIVWDEAAYKVGSGTAQDCHQSQEGFLLAKGRPG